MVLRKLAALLLTVLMLGGCLDEVPVARIRAWEHGFHDYLRAQRPEIGEAVRTAGKLDESTIEKLVAAIKEFGQRFATDAAAAAPKRTAATPATSAAGSNTDASTAGNPAA